MIGASSVKSRIHQYGHNNRQGIYSLIEKFQ